MEIQVPRERRYVHAVVLYNNVTYLIEMANVDERRYLVLAYSVREHRKSNKLILEKLLP